MKTIKAVKCLASTTIIGTDNKFGIRFMRIKIDIINYTKKERNKGQNSQLSVQ